MPYVIPCPQCAARLKAPQAVPVGRQITCPQCKTTFTTTKPAVPDDAPTTAPTTARSGPPKPPVLKPPSKPDVGSDEPEVLEAYVDDDEDRPKPKKRRDDDDERPKAKRRERDDEEEDDDRPRSKKRRDDDDEDDDQPKAKKRRDHDDEDEDDRPRAKKRRDDDEDEDDRPRKRPRRKGGNRKLLLIGALVGGGVFMLLMAVLALNLFGVFSLGGGRGAPNDMLAHVPLSATELRYMDLDELKAAEDRMGNRRPGAGFRPGGFGTPRLANNEIVALLTATSNARGFAPFTNTVMICKMRNSVDGAAVAAENLAQQRTFANKTYYSNGREHFYFPGGRVLVSCSNEAAMHEVLSRDTNPGMKPNAALMEVQSRCRGAVWTASAGPDIEKPAGDIEGVNGKLLAKSHSFSIASNRITIREERLYDSSSFASKMVKQLQSNHEQKPNSGKNGETVSFSRDGSGGVVITREAPLDNPQMGLEFGFGLGGFGD